MLLASDPIDWKPLPGFEDFLEEQAKLIVKFATPEDRADEEARRRIREEIESSFLVEAAAGTGKTTALVGRIVQVLSRGAARVHEIVAVTFTRKAAGELKLRLRQELEDARRKVTSRAERKNLEQAISRLEEARIGTIHSFCADIIRERPVEARVDPGFQELNEEEAPRLFERVFRLWIQRKLHQMPPELSRVLARLGQSPWESPLDRLNTAARGSSEWRDFEAAWEIRDFDRAALMESLIQRVLKLADISEACTYKTDYLRLDLQPARFFARNYRRLQELRHQDPDTQEADLVELSRVLRRRRRKGRGPFAEGHPRQEVLALRSALLLELEEFQTAMDADLAARLHDLFREVALEYQEQKQARGVLDFVDLLVSARNLVRDEPAVRRYLQGRFTRIFVDEFQDTDPLQAELLMLLSAEDPSITEWQKVQTSPGKLFLVGDPKQSIYRFRRADVILYQQVRQHLTRAGIETLFLSRNFRSTRPLQQLINSAFSPAMKADLESGQPDYVPLLEKGTENSAFPPLVVLPVPFPYQDWGITRKQIAAGEPQVIAAFLAWLISNDWRIRDPAEPDRWIPIEPHHITILMRKFVSWRQDLTRPYVRALEARGIPHLLMGSKSLHSREEVETLRTALQAVEWPDDELAVFATLRGSLFAFDDATLLLYRKSVGPLHPFRPREESDEVWRQEVGEALSLLAELHRRRNYVPIVATISKLLEATRAHAGFALRPSGDQVLANIRKIWDLARRYEATEGLSLRGFVESLNRKAEQDTAAEAPIIEEGAEGVRIMTLHAAKGLESPVVVLAGVTTAATAREPDKFVDLEKNLCATRILGMKPWELVENAPTERDRDQAEAVRISYVAATRARDLLVVPAVGDEPVEGWLSDLNPAIYPPRSSWRTPQPPPAACPAFGDKTVLGRPVRQEGLTERSVKPGLHRAEVGHHQVIWWDPATLELDLEPDLGIRQERILARPEEPADEQLSLQKYRQWQQAQIEARKEGGRPQRIIFRPSTAEEDPPEDRSTITVETVAGEVPSSRGRRYGTLVHTVLRDLDWEAPGEIPALARFHGASVQATTEEIESTSTVVRAALAHPRLVKARKAELCYREYPIAVRLDAGQMLEGTIDLLFQHEGRWEVIDFKTDREIQQRRQLYERQLRWYVVAVRKLMDEPAAGYLLVL